MKFRTELTLSKSSIDLNYASKVLFLGSCFSETMYLELKKRGFKYISGNPFGVLFNPISITKTLDYIGNKKVFQEVDFFVNQGVARHWDFGSQIFKEDLKTTVACLNKNINEQHTFLENANVLFVTLGTAWVYEQLEDKRVVANCHKMNASLFKKRLLGIDEIISNLSSLVGIVIKMNPNLDIVFTVSPIRHIKEGLVENQRSKSSLHVAIQSVVENYERVSYFPSYELLLDDLRDYRFYKKDLIHPNDQAVEYIWEQFKNAYLSKKTLQEIHQVEKIKKAFTHRSLYNTIENEEFKEKLNSKVLQLKKQIDFEI